MGFPPVTSIYTRKGLVIAMTLEIANRLAQLRRQHNFSQEELASLLGISRQAVSKWERAEASPDTDNLIRLAKIYSLSLDDLLHVGSGEDAETASVPCTPEPSELPINGEVRNSREWNYGALYAFPFPLFVVFGYLSMGFIFGWWHPGWLIFFTIPIYYCLIAAAQHINWYAFPFPIIIAGLYVLIGVVAGIWHPTWLLFLTIPIYYCMIAALQKDQYR